LLNNLEACTPVALPMHGQSHIFADGETVLEIGGQISTGLAVAFLLFWVVAKAATGLCFRCRRFRRSQGEK